MDKKDEGLTVKDVLHGAKEAVLVIFLMVFVGSLLGWLFN